MERRRFSARSRGFARRALEVTYCDGEVARRTFDPAPSSCADLTAVVGLAIALSLDANALTEVVERPSPAPSPPTPSRPPPPVAQTRVAEPIAHDFLKSPVGPSSDVRLARASSGAVPGWAFGGGLGFALGWRPWLVTRFVIVGCVAAMYPSVPASSARRWRRSISNQCVVARVRRFRFGPCAGLAAGPFIAEERDHPRRRRDVVAWAAATFAFTTEAR